MSQVAKHFINGRLVSGCGTRLWDVVDPARNQLRFSYPVAVAQEVDEAVECAQAAQLNWARRTGAERGAVLLRAADLLREANDDLALLESKDTGRALAETNVVDVVSAIDALTYMAGLY